MNPDGFIINTDRKLPLVGFGTWQVTPEHTAQRIVNMAIEAGYRLIDTARIYGNERGVGAAVRGSSVSREDLLVSTKLWNDDQGYDRTIAAYNASLERLGLEYIDLYLIHWPATSRRNDAWRALEALYTDGRIKAAGVSNYTVKHLKDLAEHSTLIPAVNQVEFHPFIFQQQADLLKYCQDKGIQLIGHSPINRVSNETSKAVNELAKQYDKSPQQLVLRWCIQHGVLPLARSFEPDHIKSNLAVDDFEITPSDMDTLDNLSDGRRVTWDPAGMA